jgi:hypothetical protein|nr:hypothetical protein [uncultured Albidiferax sp.]
MPSSTEAIILARVNQKILAAGETLPRVTLQDGSQLQTGTVAAMLHNVALYNAADASERGEIERELELAIPTLAKIGLFALFSPEEWCNGSNPGRQFVGLKAQAYLAGQK